MAHNCDSATRMPDNGSHPKRTLVHSLYSNPGRKVPVRFASGADSETHGMISDCLSAPAQVYQHIQTLNEGGIPGIDRDEFVYETLKEMIAINPERLTTRQLQLADQLFLQCACLSATQADNVVDLAKELRSQGYQGTVPQQMLDDGYRIGMDTPDGVHEQVHITIPALVHPGIYFNSNTLYSMKYQEHRLSLLFIDGTAFSLTAEPEKEALRFEADSHEGERLKQDLENLVYRRSLWDRQGFNHLRASMSNADNWRLLGDVSLAYDRSSGFVTAKGSRYNSETRISLPAWVNVRVIKGQVLEFRSADGRLFNSEDEMGAGLDDHFYCVPSATRKGMKQARYDCCLAGEVDESRVLQKIIDAFSSHAIDVNELKRSRTTLSYDRTVEGGIPDGLQKLIAHGSDDNGYMMIRQVSGDSEIFFKSGTDFRVQFGCGFPKLPLKDMICGSIRGGKMRVTYRLNGNFNNPVAANLYVQCIDKNLDPDHAYIISQLDKENLRSAFSF